MADWKTVGGQIASVGAPILGKIIGELIPIPGGGMLAEWGIRKLAEALGIPPIEATKPEVVATAIQNTPPDVLKAKLEAAEREAEDRYAALVKIHEATVEQNKESVKVIGQTQREEIARGVSPWHWRHQIGYCTLAFGWVTLAVFASAAFWRGVDVAALTALIGAVMPIFLTLAALNGYVAADTTALKIAAVTGQPTPTGIAAVVGTAKKG